MTKDKALKLALEKFEGMNHKDSMFAGELDEEVAAIKEALAQPAQERFHVATIGNWGRVEWVEGIFPAVGDKMYSAPPQEKNT